jgi:N-acetylglucosaminyldiphosphoundecaprenol N-acetyl-beta-D-mannosaminyltransferase
VSAGWERRGPEASRERRPQTLRIAEIGGRRAGLSVMSQIFGVRLHHLDSEQQLRVLFARFLGGDRTVRIFTPNPEILLRARDDPAYAEVLRSADLALPDGTGVALVETLRTRRRVRRWPGVEIAETLVRIGAEKDAIIAFVGGRQGVAERAAHRWRQRLPGVRIHVVGADATITEEGFAQPAELDDELTRSVAALSPSIVLVGFGAPKQECWIAQHAASIPTARIMIGIGGSFDMWATDLRRAPSLLRSVGLEWAWRLAMEPRRWPRMVRATIVFPLRVLLDRQKLAPTIPRTGPNDLRR